MSTEERPWYDKEAERKVLGSCLTGSIEVVHQVQEIFGSGNPFYLPRHGQVWSAIVALTEERITPDPVTVNQRMPRYQSNWDLRDGPVYLLELYGQAALSFNRHHARIVADFAACRTVAETAIRIQAVANAGDMDAVSTIVEQAKAQLGAIQTNGRAEPWHDLLVGGGAFVLDIPTQIPPVWGRGHDVLWAQGESLMLVGPPGVGKSTVAGQLVAARLGLLEKVLTLPVVPGQGKLLYVAGDRPAQIARSLRRTLNREEWHDVIRERLIVWRGPPPHMFTSKPETLVKMAIDAGADTVVLDSLKDVATGLGDDVPAGEFNRARQLALAAGIELLELHHQVKRGPTGQPPTELADVYGNQQITGGAGSVVLLWGQAGDSVVAMTHLKQPENPVGPWSIYHNHTEGMSRVERDLDIVRCVAQMPGGANAQSVAKIFYTVDSPSAKQLTAMKNKLDKLADQGKLARGTTQDGVATYLAVSTEEEPPDAGADERERYP